MSEKPLLEMIGIDKTFGRQTVLKNCSLRCNAEKPWC
jgi:polar amino acid transport system ATP-binding protein